MISTNLPRCAKGTRFGAYRCLDPCLKELRGKTATSICWSSSPSGRITGLAKGIEVEAMSVLLCPVAERVDVGQHRR